jgi:hypothetical protein
MIQEGYAKPYDRYSCEALADYQNFILKPVFQVKVYTRMVANF